MTTFMSPPPAATSVAFHPNDNNIVAIGFDDYSIHIYNIRIDEVVAWTKTYMIQPTWNVFMKFKIVPLKIFYVIFGQVKSKLKGHQNRVTGLTFSNVLNVLVSSGADVQVYSLKIMKWIESLSLSMSLCAHACGVYLHEYIPVSFYGEHKRLN